MFISPSHALSAGIVGASGPVTYIYTLSLTCWLRARALDCAHHQGGLITIGQSVESKKLFPPMYTGLPTLEEGFEGNSIL